MPCTFCTLLPVGNGWIAECGMTQQGPYLSKGMAFRVAASAAQALRRRGERVKISIQDETGAVSAEYCLCRRFTMAVPRPAAASPPR